MYLLCFFVIIIRKRRIKHGSLFKKWATFRLSKRDEQNVIRLKIMQYDIPDYWLNFTAILTLSQLLTELLKQLGNATPHFLQELITFKGPFFLFWFYIFKLDPQWYIAITNSVTMRHQSQNYICSAYLHCSGHSVTVHGSLILKSSSLSFLINKPQVKTTQIEFFSLYYYIIR